MARLWRLSVVVIVLTFAPMPAWAECKAWLLWGGTSAGTMDDLIPIGAWTTREECESKRVIAVEKKSATFMLLPACLPDTVDPRGAKSGR